MVQYFRVVGGAERGGILVRAEKSTLSKQLAERLATGAVVKEWQSDGHRLRFSKVSGEGPHEGWVTIYLPRTKSKLLIPCTEPALVARQEDVRQEDVDWSPSFEPPARSAAPSTAPSAASSAASTPKSQADRSTGAAATPSASSVSPASPHSDVLNLCVDGRGVLRGPCCCESCDAWQSSGGAAIPWRPPLRLGPPGASSGSVECPGLPEGGSCSSCGCSAEQHDDLSEWHDRVCVALRHFRNPTVTQRLIPSSSSVPARCQEWSANEVALYVLTAGRFQPARGILRELGASAASTASLVSVCVPTSSRRHHFHPLLYENFRQQTYSPKELVVVDTGREPSAFLKRMSKVDRSVRYYYYAVSDAKQDRVQSVAKLQHASHGRAFPSTSMYVPDPNSWSLGLKRNVAAALSSGRVIAHFDDDDLYSPEYLTHMVGELVKQEKLVSAKSSDEVQSADSSDSATEGVPALVTLKEWHLFDFSGHGFRHIDPATDPDVPPSWRSAMMKGYGFSYVYTRAAWLLQAFPDKEDCEDDIFIQKLEERGKDFVGLVPLPSKDVGLVAHSFHTDNTGVMEFNGNQRLGQIIPRPKSFEALMPMVQRISAHFVKTRPELTWMTNVIRGPGYNRGAEPQQAVATRSNKARLSTQQFRPCGPQQNLRHLVASRRDAAPRTTKA